MLIKNKDELLSHGNVNGREVILDVAEYAVKAVDAYESTKNTRALYNTLHVAPRSHAHVKVYETQDCHKMGCMIAYSGRAKVQACKMIKHSKRKIASKS
jgi:hypothetical protein